MSNKWETRGIREERPSVKNITSQVVISLRSDDDDDGDVDVDSNHKFATIATVINGIW